MKINFTRPILDEKNEPVSEGPFKTLRSTCSTALFATLKTDEALTGEKKGEMGLLGLRITHEDEIDLKSEQIAMLKDRIGKIAPNLVVHRAYELLENPESRTAHVNGSAHAAV